MNIEDELRRITDIVGESPAEVPSRTPASTIAILEQMDQERERNPLGSLTAIEAHPDRVLQIVTKSPHLPRAMGVLASLAGIEIHENPYVAKNRAMLIGRAGVIGCLDFETGSIYTFKPRLAMPPLPGPDFSFGFKANMDCFLSRYAYQLMAQRPRGYVASFLYDDGWAPPRPSRRDRKRRMKIARRARIRAENARRKVR